MVTDLPNVPDESFLEVDGRRIERKVDRESSRADDDRGDVPERTERSVLLEHTLLNIVAEPKQGLDRQR